MKAKYLMLFLVFVLVFSFALACNEAGVEKVEEESAIVEKTKDEVVEESDVVSYFKFPLQLSPSQKEQGYFLYLAQEFGNFLETYDGDVYNGFHSGEDWHIRKKQNEGDNIGTNESAGKPVYAIGPGKVLKVSKIGDGSRGMWVLIEHTVEPGGRPFIIPAKEIESHGEKASYEKEEVYKIYSAYGHLDKLVVKEGDNINNENTIIGYIKDMSGPHLHFEIRHPKSEASGTGQLAGDPRYWQIFTSGPDKGKFNGYYTDLKKMVEIKDEEEKAGFRCPSDFIEANLKISITVSEEHEQVEPEIEKRSATKEEPQDENLLTAPKLLWSKVLSLSSIDGWLPVDAYYAVDVDSSDNIIVGWGDIIKKYNSKGDELWTKILHKVSRYWLYIAVDSHSNIIGSGGWSTIKYDKNGNGVWWREIGGWTAVDSKDNVISFDGDFLSKYDSAGDGLWTIEVNVFEEEECEIINPIYSVVIDSTDNIIIAGDDGKAKAIIKKYNSSGDRLWQQIYESNIPYPGSVQVDSKNNLMIFFSYPGTDELIIKCDQNGNEIERRTLDVGDVGHTKAILDSDDNIILVGGDDHTVIIKYDSDGNKLWEVIDNQVVAEAVTTDSKNNVILTGPAAFERGWITAKYSQ